MNYLAALPGSCGEQTWTARPPRPTTVASPLTLTDKEECVGPVDGGSADDRLAEAAAETATVLPTNGEATVTGVAVEGDAVPNAADGSYGRGTDW